MKRLFSWHVTGVQDVERDGVTRKKDEIREKRKRAFF
jgi:hypothetical protein